MSLHKPIQALPTPVPLPFPAFQTKLQWETLGAQNCLLFSFSFVKCIWSALQVQWWEVVQYCRSQLKCVGSCWLKNCPSPGISVHWEYSLSRFLFMIPLLFLMLLKTVLQNQAPRENEWCVHVLFRTDHQDISASWGRAFVATFLWELQEKLMTIS